MRVGSQIPHPSVFCYAVLDINSDSIFISKIGQVKGLSWGGRGGKRACTQIHMHKTSKWEVV